MSWFKKPSEGDEEMFNSNSGRSASEPSSSRPEPRMPAQKATEAPKAPEMKAPEPAPRAPEVKMPEAAVRMTPTAPAPTPRASVLGPTLKFRGELSAQEDLVVQGSVEGSITHTQSLTIGTDGSMKGDIRARVIIIDGNVEGDLYATESVSVRTTAKVKGNVFAPRVGISEGALFQGQIDMQPSGAAVQEHSARLRQAAQNTAPTAATPATATTAAAPASGGTGGPLESTAVDQMLSSATGF
jgi:cytoskeletal protein CcmA (bactofilin family)